MLWIIAPAIGRAGSGTRRRAETAEELHSAARMTSADVVEIAAAVLAAPVVLRLLTRVQHEKALRGPVPAAV